ncbi:MAG: hypothetical protein PHW35_09680 [Lentimicrobiaceae bacterium]|jgi:hypothetical protein|nr:hypothetical protein [Lentimicrobiaceae bacterium]MDD4598223.1 hypothetical protein [Lentimicrobiaceae bacterium]
MKTFLRYAIVTVIMLIPFQALRAQYSGQLTFSLADVSISKTDGLDVVTIQGCGMETEAGKPYLPIKQFNIVIPSNKIVLF